MDRPELLVFDVNETLLDLGALQPGFADLFGSADLLGEWFARMLHGSLVANHVGHYRAFGMIGAEALITLGLRRGLDISPDRAADLLNGMRRLPPFPDAAPALARLQTAGFRMIVLTNGSIDVASDQLRNAGLDRFFERALSVDQVGRFKPAPEVYLLASATMDVEVDRMLMIAAHDWDLIGARSVGMPGAFLNRPRAVWGLPDDPPELVAPDLGVLATLLIGRTRQ